MKMDRWQEEGKKRWKREREREDLIRGDYTANISRLETDKPFRDRNLPRYPVESTSPTRTERNPAGVSDVWHDALILEGDTFAALNAASPDGLSSPIITHSGLARVKLPMDYRFPLTGIRRSAYTETTSMIHCSLNEASSKSRKARSKLSSDVRVPCSCACMHRTWPRFVPSCTSV